MSIPAFLPGGLATVLALAGTLLVAAGWVWWNRSSVAFAFGGAALLAGLLGWFGAPTLVVVLVAGVGGLGFAGLFWRWKRLVAEGNTLPPGVGAIRLVGMHADVARAVGGPDDTPIGQVRVAGESWGALTDDDTALPVGSTVQVVAVHGTRLLVTAASTTSTGPVDDDPVAAGQDGRDHRRVDPEASDHDGDAARPAGADHASDAAPHPGGDHSADASRAAGADHSGDASRAAGADQRSTSSTDRRAATSSPGAPPWDAGRTPDASRHGPQPPPASHAPDRPSPTTST